MALWLDSSKYLDETAYGLVCANQFQHVANSIKCTPAAGIPTEILRAIVNLWKYVGPNSLHGKGYGFVAFRVFPNRRFYVLGLRTFKKYEHKRPVKNCKRKSCRRLTRRKAFKSSRSRLRFGRYVTLFRLPGRKKLFRKTRGLGSFANFCLNPENCFFKRYTMAVELSSTHR